jgi:hypothetical protein
VPAAQVTVETPVPTVAASDGAALAFTPTERRWVVGGVVAVLVGLAAAVAATLVMTGGTWSYTLDDPYIHLRLSEMLWEQGTYGINPGAAAAPSSSIVWPFLLAPFSPTPLHQYVPLLINAACLVASVVLLHRLLALSWRRLDPTGWMRGVGVPALCLCLNIIGIALTGMEHSLHVALSLVVALGVARLAMGRPAPWWFWVSAAVLPMVRYEGFLIAGAAMVTAFALGRRRDAVVTLAASFIGPAVFSVALVSMGLPPLPSSVLVKSGVGGSSGGVASFLDRGSNSVTTLSLPFLLLVVSAASLVLACVAARRSGRRPVPASVPLTAAATMALLGHLLVGSNGWFGRYEVYVLAFSGSLLLVAAGPLLASFREQTSLIALVAVGVVVAMGLMLRIGITTLRSPAASRNIYEQQYQMARLAHDYLDMPVAVNDLGWVAYRSDREVLDLWGLGNDDARRARARGDDAWIGEEVAARDIPVAIVYEDSFPGALPDDWELLGCISTPDLVTVWRRDVQVYGTQDDNSAAAAAFERFAADVPDRVTVSETC